MQKKTLIIAFLFFSVINIFSQEAYKMSVEEAKAELVKKGYEDATPYYFEQYGSEFIKQREREKEMITTQYAAIREDRIIYVFYFLTKENLNIFTCAYVIDETMPPPYRKEQVNVWQDGKVVQATIEPLNEYYKKNPQKEAEIHWIHYDANDNGIMEKDEGIYVNNKFIKIHKPEDPANLWLKIDTDKGGNEVENGGRWGRY